MDFYLEHKLSFHHDMHNDLEYASSTTSCSTDSFSARNFRLFGLFPQRMVKLCIFDLHTGGCFGLEQIKMSWMVVMFVSPWAGGLDNFA